MRRNWDISMIIIVLILAGTSLRSGAFSDPMQWLMDKLLVLPAIIIGLSFHEYAHAKVAYKLGDPTPKMQGRVSINPMAHIDWIGFAALMFAGFGWGRPVEINPANFKHRRRDELLVSLAGVVMNLIIAVIFAFVAKILLLTLGYSFLTSFRLIPALIEADIIEASSYWTNLVMLYLFLLLGMVPTVRNSLVSRANASRIYRLEKSGTRM